MRIDRSFSPTPTPRDLGLQPRAKATHVAASDAAVTSTSDLVSLAVGIGGNTAPSEIAASREPAVAALRNAYLQGSIKPDPARIAAALLRFGCDASGSVGQ